MPTVVTELRALKKAVLALPADAAPKLALSDWADERGDAALAAGLRWCTANGKWPQDDTNTHYKSWCWYKDYGDPPLAVPSPFLPAWLWDRLYKDSPRGPAGRYVFRGCEALDPFVLVRRVGKALLEADRA